MSRLAVFIAGLAFAAPAAAQVADPLDLSRGLRENRLPDLALEYLDELAAKNPSPAIANTIPLERARAKLDLADDEPDLGKRTVIVNDAKAAFEKFLAANPNHPRRSEAAISLARVISVEARGILSRANKVPDDARKAELARARPVFQDAAKRFGEAAKEYAKKLDDPTLTPLQKSELTRDVYQAELDRAINSFDLARTFDPPDGAKEVEERGAAIDAAKKVFNDLGNKDPSHPLCWVALAWTGECEREKTNTTEAAKIFTAVKNSAKPVKAGEVGVKAAEAGARLASFFEIRAEYEKAFAENTAAQFRKVQGLLEAWLAPVPKAVRQPNEVYAARFYLGVVKQRQALAQIKVDAKTKKANVPDSVKTLLRDAEKDFKKLADPENDYTERAAERQNQIILLLLGEGEKNPLTLQSFEECMMAAQVQMYTALKKADGTPEERVASMRKVAALYERAREFPVAKENARDVVDAQVNLVYAYLIGDRPYQAAVLGEHLARTLKSAGPAARAGFYALQAYLATAGKLDPADTDGRRTDLDHAAAIGVLLDKQFPTDANTDMARIVVGQQLLRDGKNVDAFDMLAKVGNGSPKAANARLMQGVAAFDLLRPQQAGMNNATPALPPEKKAEIYARTIADLTALPPAPASAGTTEARMSLLVGLQLTEIYLTDKPNGYPKAEQSAADVVTRAAAANNLTADEKLELRFKAEHAKLRAIYAQIVPLYTAGKFTEVMARLGPVLGDLANQGPATAKAGGNEATQAAAKRLDDFRRDALLVLALQSRIKEGAVDKAGELLDLIKKLGGTAEGSAAAVGQLIASIRPQIDALRAEKKDDEATKLVQGVSVLLDKVLAEPNLPTTALLTLGRGARDMGNYDKAVELLTKVPAPDAELLKKAPQTIEDNKQRVAVLVYRGAQLDLARTYRLAKKFAEADKVLLECMGEKNPKDVKDKSKEKWGMTAPDFRKELAYLTEAKAAEATDPKEVSRLWGLASQKWNELALEMRNILIAPIPTDEKKRNDLERTKAQVKPIYFDYYFESMRCVTKGNLQILKAKPAELSVKLAAVAKKMSELEAANPDLSADVKVKFGDLMEEVPVLKAEYTKIPGPKGLLKPPTANQ